MSAKSILTVLGADAKVAWAWLASPTGQKVIMDAEQIVEMIDPPATGLINIANGWMAEILKTQLLSTYAGLASGANASKSQMTINSMKPQILAFAKAHGYPVPTPESLQLANDGLVKFLNAIEAK